MVGRTEPPLPDETPVPIDQPIGQYPYHVEPIQTAGIFVAVAILAIILVPNPVIQVGIGLTVSGPLVWIVFQLLRRGRGVTLFPDHVILKRALRRKLIKVPLDQWRGQVMTPAGGLLIVFQPPPRSTTLNAFAPDTEAVPRLPRPRIMALATLDSAAELVARMDQMMTAAMESGEAGSSDIPASQNRLSRQQLGRERLAQWARRRKLRDYALIILAILGIPLYVYIYYGFFRGFR